MMVGRRACEEVCIGWGGLLESHENLTAMAGRVPSCIGAGKGGDARWLTRRWWCEGSPEIGGDDEGGPRKK